MYIIRHVVIDILTPEKTVHINLQIPKKKREYIKVQKIQKLLISFWIYLTEFSETYTKHVLVDIALRQKCVRVLWVFKKEIYMVFFSYNWHRKKAKIAYNKATKNFKLLVFKDVYNSDGL